MSKTKLSRRDLFAVGTGAAAAGLLGGAAAADDGEKPSTSRVVLIRDSEVVDQDGQTDPEILHRMLNNGLTELTGEKGAAAAWRRLFSPSDVVGIKSNVWHYLPTPSALETAIRFELEKVGVSPEDIAVDDRNVKSNPVFQRATAFINTRPLRTHDWSGLGTCIKNLITSPRAQRKGAPQRTGDVDSAVSLHGSAQFFAAVHMAVRWPDSWCRSCGGGRHRRPHHRGQAKATFRG
jgi:hypothetical protein